MTDTLLHLTAQQPMYNGGGPNSWGGGMMYSPFGGLFMIILVALVAVVLVMALKGSLGGSRGPGHGGETPLDILKRRYAAGEIDKEQYEKMKQDLK